MGLTMLIIVIWEGIKIVSFYGCNLHFTDNLLQNDFFVHKTKPLPPQKTIFKYNYLIYEFD